MSKNEMPNVVRRTPDVMTSILFRRGTQIVLTPQPYGALTTSSLRR